MGIDVGTTRVKTLLFDLDGRVVGQAGQNVRLNRPREGWADQDPEELWQALLSTARTALSCVEPGERHVLGISLSTQGGTTIPVGADMRPLRDAISWMDRRAAGMMAELGATVDPEETYRLTGWRFSGLSAWAHIAWLRKFEPEIYGAARYFLQVNDYTIYRLTGALCQDPSNAGITRLYDVVSDVWAETALDAIGITQEQLSPLAPSGTPVGRLSAEAAVELGLSSDTWVMNGAHDQYAAALGAGVIYPGQVLLSCGTAWVLLVTTAEPVFGSGSGAMGVSRHAVPACWGALRSMAGVGTTVEWYVDTILAPLGGFSAAERSQAFEFMNLQIPEVPPGANGLFCLPVDGGHALRTRVRGGALSGLRADHTKADMGRAVLEGIGYELLWLIDTIESDRMPIRSLVMVGGASRSSCWPQIIADITGRPLTVPALEEAGARGAAKMAGIGLNCFTAENAFEAARGSDRQFDPEAAAVRRYSELFQEYRLIFDSLCNLA